MTDLEIDNMINHINDFLKNATQDEINEIDSIFSKDEPIDISVEKFLEFIDKLYMFTYN